MLFNTTTIEYQITIIETYVTTHSASGNSASLILRATLMMPNDEYRTFILISEYKDANDKSVVM